MSLSCMLTLDSVDEDQRCLGHRHHHQRSRRLHHHLLVRQGEWEDLEARRRQHRRTVTPMMIVTFQAKSLSKTRRNRVDPALVAQVSMNFFFFWYFIHLRAIL